jgi:hypothetical protein
VRKADSLPPSSADVTKSGSLNLPELSGPHRPVMGLLYFLLAVHVSGAVGTHHQDHNLQSTAVGTCDCYGVLEVG